MRFVFISDEGFNYDLKEENGVISVRPTFTAPKKVKEFHKLYGRNGVLTKDLETYEMRSITVPVTFKSYNIDDLSLFELEGMRGKLYFPFYFENTYFEVENVTDISIDDKYGVAEGSITFECQPFRVSDYKIKTLRNNENFLIGGNRPSIPILEIKASGDVSFALNSQGVSVIGVEGSIIINLEAQEIYKKNSDGTFIPQGSKVTSMNLTKIKLLAKKKNVLNDLTSNVTEFKVKYKENYI